MAMKAISRKLSELTQLETEHLELLADVRILMEALKPVRSMFRNLRVDLRDGHPTDPEWLDRFDRAAEAAWGACKAVYERLPEIDPEPIGPVIVDVVRAAKDVVQADNHYGRAGSEQRWDKAMDALKRVVVLVRVE